MSLPIPDYGNQVVGIGSLGRVVNVLGDYNPGAKSVRDSTGNIVQSDVITPTSPDNSSEYSIRIQATGVNELVSYTTDGTATAAEVTAGFVAAIAALDTLTGILVATDGTTDFTLTWRRGITGTVTIVANPSSALALVTTAASDGANYQYGYACEVVSETIANSLKSTLVRIPAASGTAVFGIIHDDQATAPGTLDGEVTGPDANGQIAAIFATDGRTDVVVYCEDSVSFGGTVYVGDGTNSTVAGQFYASSGSGKAAMAGATFVANGDSNTAIVRL